MYGAEWVLYVAMCVVVMCVSNMCRLYDGCLIFLDRFLQLVLFDVHPPFRAFLLSIHQSMCIHSFMKGFFISSNIRRKKTCGVIVLYSLMYLYYCWVVFISRIVWLISLDHHINNLYSLRLTACFLLFFLFWSFFFLSNMMIAPMILLIMNNK